MFRPYRRDAQPGRAPLALDSLALAVPSLRGLREMRFRWDRPDNVDASQWVAHFWSDVTPFDLGVPQTMQSFRVTGMASAP